MSDPFRGIVIVVVQNDTNVAEGGLVGPVSQEADRVPPRAWNVPNREALTEEAPTEDFIHFGLFRGRRSLDENPFEEVRIVLVQNQVSQKEQ